MGSAERSEHVDSGCPPRPSSPTVFVCVRERERERRERERERERGERERERERGSLSASQHLCPSALYLNKQVRTCVVTPKVLVLQTVKVLQHQPAIWNFLSRGAPDLVQLCQRRWRLSDPGLLRKIQGSVAAGISQASDFT